MNVLITNETVKQLFHIATSIAKENYNARYGASHLLMALMHKDIDLNDFLFSLDKEPNYFYEWAEVRIEEYPKVVKLPEEVSPDQHVSQIIEQAEEVMSILGLNEVTALCILTALVKPHVAFTPEELKSLPLRDHEVFAAFKNASNLNLFEKRASIDTELFLSNESQEFQSFTALKNYCIDLTAQARSGQLRGIVGREKETRTLIEVLGRKSKPNVILVGEPGVGKTALVEGFAKHITRGDVPTDFKNAYLLQIDLSMLLAGTSYKGEIEDRLKKVLNESKKLGKTILFIDEIHSLLDSKGHIGNVANLLKPELARGEITVVGTSTQEEYRKVIEPEQAFNRRFEVLEVEEPDSRTCLKMLESSVEIYENHHNVVIEKGALKECIRLAKRYSKGKKLPDSAIDLLDRTMAAIKMLDELSLSELESWKLLYDEIYQTNFEDDKEKSEELIWQYHQLQNMISPILWGSLTEQPELESKFSSLKINEIIGSVYQQLLIQSALKREAVGTLELAAVMAAKTNIPIGKIQAQEKEKLLNMEALLQNRVVGQEHALKVLSDAIIESRSGLNKQGQPIGSFFLLGPTGTGKTELAKSIAELLFNDEKAMIRFDMSEFKEEHAAALLYGAPPGYVGYEEGGVLVNKIRQQPYAVVLFDEIEKAHQSIFDVFLQIMDEGKVHDKLGKEGDFSNALILFTSNIGSEFISREFAKGLIPKSKELMELMSQNFRPEFLARITEIIPFSPITDAIAEKIFSIQLKGLIASLDRLGIRFKISEEAINKLALTGFNAAYGARQISGVIRQQIARPISRMIVKEEVLAGQEIEVSWGKDAVIFNVNTQAEL